MFGKNTMANHGDSIWDLWIDIGGGRLMHSLIHAKARGFGSLPDLFFQPHKK
jgi:hypothetical protein